MTDFASSALSAHPGVSAFYFAAGFVFGWVATTLIPTAIIGMFLRPVPRHFGRVVEGLGIVLAIASAIVSLAYLAELWIACFGQNRYEFFTLIHAQFGFSTWYAWFYWLSLLSNLVPQLLWWPRLRRSFLAVLLIAIGACSGIWYERLVIAITTTLQDSPSSSWRK